MTAVAALPHLHLTLGKDLGRFHIVQQSTIPLLVMLLHCGNQTETLGQLREAFFLSRLGKALVHVRPLVILSFCSGGQILGRVANALQFLEPQLGMLLLVFSRLQEQSSNLLKPLLLCYRGKVGVLIPCLGFSCKGFPQVLLRLGAGILGALLHHAPSFQLLPCY